MGAVAPSPSGARTAWSATTWWTSPPLTWLCALSALLALAINQVIVPGRLLGAVVTRVLPQATDTASWFLLQRIGDFFSLTSVLAGCVALPFAVAPFAFGKRVNALRRPSIIGFCGLLLFVVLKAAIMERHHTSGQEVFLAVGAAHLLGISVLTNALADPRPLWQRITLAGASVMVLSALVGHVAETLAGVTLLLWQLKVARLSHWLGEFGYLLALCALAYGLFTQTTTVTATRVFRLGTLALLGMCGTAYVLLSQQLGQEFSLVLYSAQRLHALGEYSLLLYAPPLTVALASGLMGLFVREPLRRHWAEALLLLLVTGYAPRTPATLITLGLGLTLIANRARSAALQSPVASRS